MQVRVKKDVVGGAGVVAVGAIAFVHSVMSYQFGTPARMGPGLFPATLGVVLVGFGLAIALLGRARPSETVVFELRPLVLVLVAIAAFALLAPRVGLIPAVVVLTLLGILAAPDGPGPVASAALCVVVAGLAWLIFVQGLAIQLPAFSWRF